MNNPYAAVNWPTILKIASATHMHITDQATLDNGYRHRIRHFPISNYYPSAPYDAQTKPGTFKVRQHWPAGRREGPPLNPPINWNEIITWRDEIAEPFRSELPFSEGERAFTNIPSDAILSPNAEHHGFTNSKCHICSPGSSFISGNFDPSRSKGRNFRLRDHGFAVGFGGAWQEGFRAILERLDYPDGGGIVICHPTWFSSLPYAQVLEMLDFNPRVLGIEIYNDYSGQRKWSETPGYQPPSEPGPGLSLNLWDRILTTGRRCWGFSVPDHSVQHGGDWTGRCILLITERTEQECLRAYRQGRFYACLKDNGLTVAGFTATATSVSVSVSAPARIKFITESGLVATVAGKNAQCRVAHPVYVRVEVEDDSGERLFLQPVMYK